MFSSVGMEARDAPAQNLGEESVGWQALGPALGCTSLALMVVAARWYTRCRIAKCSGWDDWIILLSMVLSCAMTIIIGFELHAGIGHYEDHISAMTVAKLVVANNNLWILTVNITKLSILVQYLRIFSSRVVRILCIILMSLLLPAVFWGIFGGTFLCTPIAKLWDPRIPGTCMSAQHYWYSVAAIDIGLDFSILVLPLPAIASLRLPRKQKIGLVLVFLLGFFICVVSLVRVVTVLVATLGHEYVQSGIWAIVWSAVEANVGIICASLLALKPLVLECCPTLMVETEPPRHSMRLPKIEDEEASSESALKTAAVVNAGSVSSNASPIPPTSQRNQCFSRPDTGTTVAGDAEKSADGGGHGEILGFLDMLPESSSEVGAHSRR